jgi:heat shock protein HslJ
VLAGTEVTATFQAGQVSGNAGCNNYGGGYTVNGNAITFSAIAGTLRFCEEPGVMEQESAYLAALQGAAQFEVTGDALYLRNSAGAIVLTYVPQPQVALEGTSWVADAYNNGREAVVSVLVGTEITARFEGGRLSGSAGCNTYMTSYTVSGNRIEIGPAASTRMLCASPMGVMEQEAAYLAALPMANVYRIEGDRLILETTDGARVASFATVSARPAAEVPPV